MISQGDLRFNCCESTLVRINQITDLPGFDPNVMRIASAFGGGIGSSGSACGAVSGAAMALGLIYGTNGDESSGIFSDKRGKLKEKTKEFIAAFNSEFDEINCIQLLGVDYRTEEGLKRYRELTGTGVFRCNDYVKWAANWIVDNT